jgi:hypothetical protein
MKYPFITIITGSRMKALSLAEKLCPESWDKALFPLGDGTYRVYQHQYDRDSFKQSTQARAGVEKSHNAAIA